MNVPSYKPLIGINLENKPAFRGVAEYDFIASDYIDAVVQAGGVPVLVPPVDNLDLIQDMISPLDGFLFVGGPDLDPRNDGYMLHASVRLMSRRRERFDRALMNEVASRRMPVMGVGVGMQLLNVSQGGALFLHLPEDLPNALPHRSVQNDHSLRHRVIVEKGTLLYSVYGDNEVRVNSNHHMAVDDVAPSFVVSARCPGMSDGKAFSENDSHDDCSVIEAIESDMEDWFAIGVQFHPEVKLSATDLDRQIFNEFIKGVIVYKETGRNVLVMKPRAKDSSKKARKQRGNGVLVGRSSRS